MGEIADMMLDGTLCQSCGTFIGDSIGYPVNCSDCEDDKSRKPKRNQNYYNNIHLGKVKKKKIREFITKNYNKTPKSHEWSDFWLSLDIDLCEKLKKDHKNFDSLCHKAYKRYQDYLNREDNDNAKL